MTTDPTNRRREITGMQNGERVSLATVDMTDDQVDLVLAAIQNAFNDPCGDRDRALRVYGTVIDVVRFDMISIYPYRAPTTPPKK